MRRLGQVAIVFAALLVLVQLPAMATAAFAVSAIWESGGPVSFALAGVALLPVLIALGMALLIIVKRRELANRLFDDEEIAISVDATSLMRIALVTLGVVIATQAISGFLYGVSNAITQAFSVGPAMAGNEFGQLGAFIANISMAPVVSLVMFAIGLWLIRGSDAFAKRLCAAPTEVAAESDAPGIAGIDGDGGDG